ncbi:MAG: FG-GAP-like repeat-containing protein, partial [Bacteroidota bacterium]
DQLEDIYLTGAKGQSGELWIQQKGGKFVKSSQAYFNKYVGREDVDAVLTDINGDKTPDLVVVSGGYLSEDPNEYAPSVAINDGKGNFTELPSAIRGVSVNAAVVRAADADGDGDTDLFIGARSVPKRFPLAQPSALLLNDGRGTFAPSPAWLPAGGALGLISDAVWTDLNRDGKPDLIIAGEYNPVRCFINQGNVLAEETTARFPAETEGWWLSLKVADLDGDGDEDLIAGNWGMNNQMKVDEQHPARLAVKDFDGNGSVDPIPGYTIQGKLYPGLSLDELLAQLPSRKKVYTNYESYSGVDFETLLSGDFGKDASFLELKRFATTLFINDGSGKFTLGQLPLQAQFSPVYAIETADVNRDGITDLLLAGNQSTTRISMGKMDAIYGLLLLGKGSGQFEAIPQHRSGLSVTGDVKGLHYFSDGRLLVSRNNSATRMYRLRR